MNMYDKAYELARAIKESSEYKGMLEARIAVDADPDSKRMLEDFRSKQIDFQQRMLAGDMPPKEEMEQMEQLYEVVSMNASIRMLFEAERRFSPIMEDIQKVIAEPLRSLFA